MDAILETLHLVIKSFWRFSRNDGDDDGDDDDDDDGEGGGKSKEQIGLGHPVELPEPRNKSLAPGLLLGGDEIDWDCECECDGADIGSHFAGELKIDNSCSFTKIEA